MSTNKTTNLQMHSWTGTDYVKRTEFNENFDSIDKLAGLQVVDGDVRVATTANITLSGTQTIDGIALAVGDRVLVKNQTTASQNGIYDVSATAWTRSFDIDSSAKIKVGMKVFTKEGTANGKQEWRLTNTGAITLGTTSLTFELVNGANSVTDSFIGNRTVDQATATAFSNTGVLTQILSWFAKQLKAITGATNWYDAPAATISSLNTNKANLASPALTGTPTAPTAAGGTNTTQIATTAFVTAAAYTHPSGDGNLHVPATSTTNNLKVLKAGATAGSAAWGVINGSEIVEDSTHRLITDAERTSWNAKASTAVVTTSANGLMIAADKVKLDGVATGANNYSHPTGDGNLHVPATSTTNNLKVLKAGATAGSLSWAVINASEVVEDTTHRFITDAERTTWNAKAPLASPALTGVPTGPTAAQGTDTTQLATTAFVNAEITADIAGKADLASPSLTGVPTAPTPGAGTNTTQIATTAYVQTELTNDLATVAPLMDGVAAVGVATKKAREDHKHPVDTSRAPLASPALTGTPTAPTAAQGTNTTQIATTAFVINEGYQKRYSGSTTDFNTALTHGFYSFTATVLNAPFTEFGILEVIVSDGGTHNNSTNWIWQIARFTNVAKEFRRNKTNSSAWSSWAEEWNADTHNSAGDPHTQYAPKASPALTGTPTAPTAAQGTNTTQIATTAFVLANEAITVNSTGTDINTLTSNGSYFISSPVNGADGTGSIYVHVIRHATDANFILQNAYSRGTNKIFTRRREQGTWTAWAQVSHETMEMADGTNINTLTAPQKYYVYNGANAPVASIGFYYDVIPHPTNVQYLTQTAYMVNENKVYTRRLSAGTWTAWSKLYNPVSIASSATTYYASDATIRFPGFTYNYRATIKGRYRVSADICVGGGSGTQARLLVSIYQTDGLTTSNDVTGGGYNDNFINVSADTTIDVQEGSIIRVEVASGDTYQGRIKNVLIRGAEVVG